MLKNKKMLTMLICVFVIASVCTIVFGITFLSKYNNNQNEANKITSVYSDSKIDFIIPSPSEQQVQEMKEMDHIEDVFACRSVYTNISAKGKSQDTYILLLDDLTQLENTMFKKSRILSQNAEFSDKSLIIDESFARQHNLKLGDEVTWNISKNEAVTLVVDAICLNNVLDNNQVIAFKLGLQKEIIERITDNKAVKISSAYINSSNIEKTDEMLKSYQPLGRLKTPEDFSVYIEYLEYIESFNKTDFYLQIIKTENYKIENEGIANKYQMLSKVNIITFLCLLVVSSFAVSFVINFVGRASQFVVSKIRDGAVPFKTVGAFALSNIIVAILVSAVGFITVLINVKNGTGIASLAAVMIFVGICINMMIQILIIKRTIRVKKK